MDSSLLGAVADLLADECGISSSRMTAASTLFGDLGIAGLDGAALLRRFGERFSVETSTVDWTRYFGEEGMDIGLGLRTGILRAMGRSAEEAGGVTPLTIADLVASAEAGRWSTPSALPRSTP